jgi:hypothetical protein
LFPTARAFLPTPRSIPKRKPTGKEFATIHSVKDNLPHHMDTKGREKKAGHTLLRNTLIGSVTDQKPDDSADAATGNRLATPASA